jgi:hypothetical protein
MFEFIARLRGVCRGPDWAAKRAQLHEGYFYAKADGPHVNDDMKGPASVKLLG